MKLLKILVISLTLVLASCSFNLTQDDVNKAKDVFSEQLDNLYALYENGAKNILSDFSIEKAETMLNDVLAKIPEDKKELINQGIEKGITLVEDGKEVLANELSMNVSLEGVQEEIEAFLDSLSTIDARLSLENVKIEKTNDTYKLDCTINFFYKSGK